MEVLGLNDVLKILHMYKVRVKNGRIIVTGGERFPVHVRSAIIGHKNEILEIYGEQKELMGEIDAMEKRAREAEDKLFENATDLWQRYFMLCESLKFYLPKPWATVPEDQKRCSYCPNLGKPAVDGVICDHKCEKPY